MVKGLLLLPHFLTHSILICSICQLIYEHSLLLCLLFLCLLYVSVGMVGMYMANNPLLPPLFLTSSITTPQLI